MNGYDTDACESVTAPFPNGNANSSIKPKYVITSGNTSVEVMHGVGMPILRLPN